MEQQLEILLELVISMGLGAIIGFDREAANKPAGLRTHMLVAAFATLLINLSFLMLSHFHSSYQNILNIDPMRMVEAIITGISFLGAGTIFRTQGQNYVEGLTTAASILFSSAIGICVALQQFLLAGGAALFGLMVLNLFRVVSVKSQD